MRKILLLVMLAFLAALAGCQQSATTQSQPEITQNQNDPPIVGDSNLLTEPPEEKIPAENQPPEEKIPAENQPPEEITNVPLIEQKIFEHSQISVGDYTTVRIGNSDNLPISGTVGNINTKLRFYSEGSAAVAFLAIPYTASPGDYPVTITRGEESAEFVLKVIDKEFDVQNLTMDSTTESTVNTSDANNEWNEKIEPLKYIYDDKSYLDGNFIQPVDGEVTTWFGTIRYTNGSKNSTRHSGTDIANKEGTPIKASNAGRVQFAGFLKLTGYTIIIEHGYGLKTWHYHMSEINVSENQMVAKGDVIGKIGSTGYSTGPHLHYGCSIGAIFTRPYVDIVSEIN